MKDVFPRTCPRITPAGRPCGKQIVPVTDEDGTYFKCHTCGHIVGRFVRVGEEAPPTIARPAIRPAVTLPLPDTSRPTGVIVTEVVRRLLPKTSFNGACVRDAVLAELKAHPEYLTSLTDEMAPGIVESAIDREIDRRIDRDEMQTTVLDTLKASPEFVAAIVNLGSQSSVDGAIEREAGKRGLVRYGDDFINRDELGDRALAKAATRGWDVVPVAKRNGQTYRIAEMTKIDLRRQEDHHARHEEAHGKSKRFFRRLADAMPNDDVTVKEVMTPDDVLAAQQQAQTTDTPQIAEPA